MKVNVPYSAMLKGSSTRNNLLFGCSSEPQFFLDPVLQNVDFKFRENEDAVKDENDQDVYLPVLEIQSYSFDHWTIMNSRRIRNGRLIPFTQALSLDGTRLSVDLREDGRDRLRRGIGQVLEKKELFLDRDEYLEYAEKGKKLMGGEVSLELPETATWEARTDLGSDLSSAIIRIWQACWERVCWMRDKGASWKPRQANYVDIVLSSAPDAGTDPLEECKLFFEEKLLPAMPPQLLSIVSVTLGASWWHASKWSDSACRIYGDSRIRLQNGTRAFDFRKWREDEYIAPDFPSTEIGYLIRQFAHGKLPGLYEAIVKKKPTIEVRADFNFLCDCATCEFCGDYYDHGKRELRGRMLDKTITLLEGLLDRMMEEHQMSGAEIYDGMTDFLIQTIDRIDNYGQPMQQKTYGFLLGIYSEMNQHNDEDKARELCDRLLRLLGNQVSIPDYDRGSALDYWNETKGVDETELDPLSLRLIESELSVAEQWASLGRQDYTTWCGRYQLLEGRQEALCQRIEAMLSGQLSFNDDVGDPPLTVVEQFGLDNIALGIVRNRIRQLYDEKKGRLSQDEYNEALDYMQDVRVYYYDSLNEEDQLRLLELICGQTAFADFDVKTADILSKRGLDECWNRVTMLEIDAFATRVDPMTDEQCEDWMRRLKCDQIQDECANRIISVMASRMDSKMLKQYADRASADDEPSLEEACICRMLSDLENVRSITTEAYRWWIQKYQEALEKGQPFANAIFSMLLGISLKDGSDKLGIAMETGQWTLLGKLVIASIEKITNLTPDKYSEWIKYYKALDQNRECIDLEAIGRIKELLLRKVTADGVRRFVDLNVRGDIYWEAVQSLLDHQKDLPGGNMQETTFCDWLTHLKNAGEDGNPLEKDIQDLLSAQYRLRTHDGTAFAWDVAANNGADPDLLSRLIITEYHRAIANNPPLNIELARRWLRHYRFMKAQGYEEMAANILDKLKRTPVYDRCYVLDIAEEEGLQDLRLDFIQAEKTAMLQGRAIGRLDLFERWLGHYQKLMDLGQSEMADEIASKLCASPIVEGQYVLGTVLDSRVYALEKNLIDQELEIRHEYSSDDYRKRLQRLFIDGAYTNDYIRLVTDPQKGNPAALLDYFLSFLQDEVDRLPTEKGPTVSEIFRKLTSRVTELPYNLVKKMYELTNKRIMQDILRANQDALKAAIQCGIANRRKLAELRLFYDLLDMRMPALDQIAVEESALAVFSNDDVNPFERLINDYRDRFGITLEMEAKFMEKLNRQDGRHIAWSMVERANTLIQSMKITPQNGIQMLLSLLKHTEGAVRLERIIKYAKELSWDDRKATLREIAEWMGGAHGQESDTLNCFMVMANELIERNSPMCREVFEKIRSYIAHNNDCGGVTTEIYAICQNLWSDYDDFYDAMMPLLNAIGALKDAMTQMVRAKLAKGPFEIGSSRFDTVVDCRNSMEIEALQTVLESSPTIDALKENLTTFSWLDEASAKRTVGDENIKQQMDKLTQRTLSAKHQAFDGDGNSMPYGNALDEMCRLVSDIEYAAFREQLDQCINQRICKCAEALFEECCGVVGADMAQAIHALTLSEKLMQRIETNEPRPLSVKLYQWCLQFSEAVAGHSGSDSESERLCELLRQLNTRRADSDNLRLFCLRVYEKRLKARQVREKRDVIALCCVAKSLLPNKVFWPSYLVMALHRDPNSDNNIWSGDETLILQTLTYTYEHLEGIVDDVVSQTTLSDYCATETHIVELQRKKKNDMLRKIIRKSSHVVNGNGWFGWFGRK